MIIYRKSNKSLVMNKHPKFIHFNRLLAFCIFLFSKVKVRFLCHGLNQPEVNCVLTKIGLPRFEIFKSFSFPFTAKRVEHKKLTSKANKRLPHFICLT